MTIYSMLIKENYISLTDLELVSCIITDGNEEAFIYLLYQKSYARLTSIVWNTYGDTFFLNDLMNELYIHLKKNNWKALRTYEGKAQLTTWIYRVASNLFHEKQKLLIDFSEKTVTLEKGILPPENETLSPEQLDRLVELYDAIARLANDDYKFVLLKELEGYHPDEIAEQLTNVRIEENRLTDNKSVTVANVYNIKKRAINKVALMIKQKCK
jgi:RNA polymerase sigma factor (sigma-70 family)